MRELIEGVKKKKNPQHIILNNLLWVSDDCRAEMVELLSGPQTQKDITNLQVRLQTRKKLKSFPEILMLDLPTLYICEEN